MKKILFILSLLLMITPAFAQTVEYSANSDEAVWAIDISTPVSTHGTIELYQANGDTVTGSWSYDLGIPLSIFRATLGGDTSSYSFVAPLPVGMQIWNGDNTTFSREIKLGYGQIAYGWSWNDVITTNIDRAVITGYRISADNTITVTPEVVSRVAAASDLNAKTGEPGLVDLIRSYVPLVVSVFLSLVYWLKFIFIDHLILTASLYFTGSMAYAIWTSRNIFQFYKTWFGQQRKFFEFMAGAFSTTFQIVTQVALVVGNAVGSLINVALIAARILLRI